MEVYSYDLRRHETLADRVFAIVMTLLALELSMPILTDFYVGANLVDLLAKMWPKFLSYVLSFVIVSLFWLHNTFLFCIPSEKFGHFPL